MSDNVKQVKKVIGIERGVNKKFNTPYTILHTVCTFDDYAVSNRGALGQKVENTYIRGNILCGINDMVSFQYQPGFNNEAVVSGVDILERAK